jgi:hypothetical protein
MQATVEFDGHSVICDLIYPNSESPMSVSESLGTQSWQQTPYSLSNAKLVLQEITPLPNECVIKTKTTTYRATVNMQHGDEIWCSISA